MGEERGGRGGCRCQKALGEACVSFEDEDEISAVRLGGRKDRGRMRLEEAKAGKRDEGVLACGPGC